MLTAVYANPVTEGAFVDTEFLRHPGYRARRLDHHLDGFLLEFGIEALLRSRQLLHLSRRPSYWMDCPEASGTSGVQAAAGMVARLHRLLGGVFCLGFGPGRGGRCYLVAGQSRQVGSGQESGLLGGARGSAVGAGELLQRAAS